MWVCINQRIHTNYAIELKFRIGFSQIGYCVLYFHRYCGFFFFAKLILVPAQLVFNFLELFIELMIILLSMKNKKEEKKQKRDSRAFLTENLWTGGSIWFSGWALVEVFFSYTPCVDPDSLIIAICIIVFLLYAIIRQKLCWIETWLDT